MVKEKTCCLTGHRPKNLPWGYNESHISCKSFKKDLLKLLRHEIKCGSKYFLTGMAEGYDMIATEILIKLRKRYNIKITAVVPCIKQEIKWSLEQKKRYRDIVNKCDNIIMNSNKYTKTCMNDRNRFMVENSNIVVACYNGKQGGTANTIKMAKEKGLIIRIINPEDY